VRRLSRAAETGNEIEQAAPAFGCFLGGVLGRHARRLRLTFAHHLLHEADPLLAQDPLHAANGVALAVEEMADAAQEVDVLGPVIPATPAAFPRPPLRAQHFPA